MEGNIRAYLRRRRCVSGLLPIEIRKPPERTSPAAIDRGLSAIEAPCFSMISTAAWYRVMKTNCRVPNLREKTGP